MKLNTSDNMFLAYCCDFVAGIKHEIIQKWQEVYNTKESPVKSLEMYHEVSWLLELCSDVVYELEARQLEDVTKFKQSVSVDTDKG